MTQRSERGSYVAALTRHLAAENPVLLRAVSEFATLDTIGQELGILPPDYSTASQISWWPVIAVLGTFSSGKSTFINQLLGDKIQRTGNQAVDDKFTVLCHGEGETPHTLPGIALDADPRFPFFQISHQIEGSMEGEGDRINAYLQLKTCPSSALKGKILIDSPGFDADEQRSGVLRITEHIIDISDLVLIFFDARHPEAGAMRDTLTNLVNTTIRRPDADKFLYILNQIDMSAREDNLEDVVAAWQRALAGHALTAGRFYTIYSDSAAAPMTEPLRQRYSARRDKDLAEIFERMQQIEVDRAYRILRLLESSAREMVTEAVPALQQALTVWHRRVRYSDALMLALLTGVFFWLDLPMEGENQMALKLLLGGGLLVVWGISHTFLCRAFTWLGRRRLARWRGNLALTLGLALVNNTSPWPVIKRNRLKGWNPDTQARLDAVAAEAKGLIQELNDAYTSPDGTPTQASERGQEAAAAATESPQAGGHPEAH